VDDLRVTISIGVAAFPHVQADTPAALVKAADTALYQAKREGRNRVCAAGICQQST
jgi:diguanylate cyclase (GGDEF)-like protein